VGGTAGSREVPRRKPVTRDNNDNDDDDDHHHHHYHRHHSCGVNITQTQNLINFV
jgi:hypothetical protein